MIANADRTPRAKAIGWTRSGDGFGRVTKYHIKTVCNCITSFWGGVQRPTDGTLQHHALCLH